VEFYREKKGYLIVRFNDSEIDQRMDLQPLLHDYPEQVIRFMWEKYSRSAQAMSYVEECAKGEITLGRKKTAVMQGFKSLNHYLEGKPWRDVSVMRLQQQPAWDEKVLKKKEPPKKNGKPIADGERQLQDGGNKGLVSRDFGLSQMQVDAVGRAAVREVESTVDHSATAVMDVGGGRESELKE
jgi:hypothetical protein